MVTDAAGLVPFATRFVVRVGVGDPDDASRPRSGVHASMTLLRLPDRRVGVTCQHVVEAYRERRRRDAACAFQAGGVTLDPEARLLAEEPLLDLAILDLKGLETGALSVEGSAGEFFEPAAWPLGSAEAGETIVLAGCGGQARHAAGRPDAAPAWDATAIGARMTRVIDAGAENIACEIAADPSDALAAMGGLSGGPGFVRRGPEVHLAGVMFAVARSGAYLRLRPARFIRRDGTLLPRGSG